MLLTAISLEEINQLSPQTRRDVQGCRGGAELCACEWYPCSGCYAWVTQGQGTPGPKLGGLSLSLCWWASLPMRCSCSRLYNTLRWMVSLAAGSAPGQSLCLVFICLWVDVPTDVRGDAEPKHRGDGLKCKSTDQGISIIAGSWGMWLRKTALCFFPHLTGKVLEVGQHTSWTQDLTQYRPDPALTAGVNLFFVLGLRVPCCLTCGRGEIPTFPPSRWGDSEVVSPTRANHCILFPFDFKQD